MENRGGTLVKIMAVLACIASAAVLCCGGNLYNNGLDSGEKEIASNATGLVNTVALWDTTSEPKVSGTTSSSYTMSWTPVTNAAKYAIYKVTAWSPFTTTKIGETTTNYYTISSIYSVYYISAINSQNAEIDGRCFDGYHSSNATSAQDLQDTFADDFSDGSISGVYGLYSGGSTTVESGGYLHITTLESSEVYIIFNCGSKNMLSIKFNKYDHRIDNYYNDQLYLMEYNNNIKALTMYLSSHQSANGFYGTMINVNVLDAKYRATSTTSQFSSMERFDQWYTTQIVLNRITKIIKVYINGTQVGSDYTIPYQMDAKLLLRWYVGDYNGGGGGYMNIDDLEVKSVDTLAELGL